MQAEPQPDNATSPPVSPVTKKCSSGHVLLVSMQKLRDPGFQRFGADLRKTLMITSVIKSARKFYQLGSHVPVNCNCGIDDDISSDLIQCIPCEPVVKDVKMLRKSKRRNSAEASKTSAVVELSDSQTVPTKENSEIENSRKRVVQNGPEVTRHHRGKAVPSKKANRLYIPLAPSVVRYIQLSSSQSPPIKKRRMGYSQQEPSPALCIPASIC